MSKVNARQVTPVVLGDENTGAEIKELNLTITPAQLISMNHKNGYFPEDGLEILPAPGTGKCYVLSLDGMFAAYKSQNTEGYVAVPFRQYRTLDIYYPINGKAGSNRTNVIVGIPLMAEPFSEMEDMCNAPDTDELLYKHDDKESLMIDHNIDTTVYQQNQISNLGTGFSRTSTINKPLYIGTNGEIKKIFDSSTGTVQIRLWYSIIDVSDLITSHTIQNPLPGISNPYMSTVDGVDFNLSGINFNDIVAMIPTFSELDNYPTSGVFSDYETTFRAYRDSYLKTINEYLIDKSINANGFKSGTGTRLSEVESVNQHPYPTFFYKGGTYNIPYPNGPKYTVMGWPTEVEFIPAKMAKDVPYPGVFGQGITIGWNNTQSQMYWDPNVNRVESLTIVSGGTGYTTGDTVVIAAGSDGTASAEITKVDTATGEILEMELIPANPSGQTGGWNYLTPPAVSITTGVGIGASITAVLGAGQWVETMQRNGLEFEDLATTKRAVRDAHLKSINEVILAINPMISACLYWPGFNIKKYKS